MHISFLCSDNSHPVNEYLKNWINKQQDKHIIELVQKKSELSGGDILFLISCSEIINEEDDISSDSFKTFVENSTAEELEKAIKEIIVAVGATSMKDMGKVMKIAKERIGTRADGKDISDAVKKILA